MSSSTSDIAAMDTKTIAITRTFNAPVETVWRAFSEPEHLMQWWGPKIYTAPSAEIDFRVGGKFIFCMRGPDGKDLYSTGIYREIVPMEKIVSTDSFSDAEGNVVPASEYGMEGFPDVLLVTFTFEDVDGKTRMTLRHEGIPAGEMYDMCMVGWNESFDKLETAVENESNQGAL